MVTSDFRPEVEIRQFPACAMKNTQYNVQQQCADCLAAVFSVISKSCNFVTLGQSTE